MSATFDSVPPEYATTPPKLRTMPGSMDRTDRTGPTLSGAAELNIAQKRVMPPSTTSSKTTSATSRPACGRDSGVFSIFTASDERPFATLSGSGRPVSGAFGMGIVVVVVLVLVGAGLRVDFASSFPPPSAKTAAAVAPSTTTAAPAITGVRLGRLLA